ncbi:MAG: hypothetical protein M0Z30_11245 [Actinomycetota bacterium]|nr:hypothetical protein [Actinomycetota bacterium]
MPDVALREHHDRESEVDDVNRAALVEPVMPMHATNLEVPVEELLRDARPLPLHEEMLIDDLDEVEGAAFLAALKG